jgi:hypothetical protein
MIYPAAAAAVVGVAIGGKVGYADYTGDILPASGDVGTGVMFGAVLEFSALPVIDFELHANYFAKDFEYTYNVASVPVSTEFEFRDIHVLALAKKNLIAIPMSPLGVYIGGGVGWHLINTEAAKGFAYNATAADNPAELMSNSARLSGHGLLGIKISPPAIPLAIFGEARWGRIFTDEGLNTTQVEGGLMLSF